jgi:ribosomal protein S12 methylthiotransferase accessory factor
MSLKLNQEVTLSLQKIYTWLKRNPSQVITSFSRSAQFYDEPPFFLFHTEIAVDPEQKYFGANGEGFAFHSKELAALKALMEGFERYSLYTVPKKILKASLTQLRKQAKSFLDPDQVVSFTTQQLQQPQFKNFQRTSSSVFGWVAGKSLESNKSTLLPAQLVYLTYSRSKSEPSIHVPLSTGAAASSSREGAILSGIFEVVERDAFMITYLNRLERDQVDLDSDPELERIKKLAQEYQLEPYLIDISSDLSIYSFLGVLIDKTGKGPVISLGLKSGLNPQSTMLGALQEAFHPRAWVRSQMIEHQGHKHAESSTCRTLVDRALFWSNLQHLHLVDFLFNTRMPIKKVGNYKNLSTGETKKDLQKVKTILQQHGLQGFYCDITPEKLKGAGVKCVKVLIPQLQPLYLDDLFPYHGGVRLYDVPQKLFPNRSLSIQGLLDVPHPFL